MENIYLNINDKFKIISYLLQESKKNYDKSIRVKVMVDIEIK
jgi:hypothetical protein